MEATTGRVLINAVKMGLRKTRGLRVESSCWMKTTTTQNNVGVRKSVKLPLGLWDIWSNFLVVCMWKKKLICLRQRIGLKLYCTSLAVISTSKRSACVGLNSVTWKHTGIVAAFVYSKSDNLLFQENKGSLCPQTIFFWETGGRSFIYWLLMVRFRNMTKGNCTNFLTGRTSKGFLHRWNRLCSQ